MADPMAEFNKKVIDEFHANGGKVGGQFAGAPMIIITHKGAKSGTTYISPLVYSTQARALRSTDMEKGVAGPVSFQPGHEAPAGQDSLPMTLNSEGFLSGALTLTVSCWAKPLQAIGASSARPPMSAA